MTVTLEKKINWKKINNLVPAIIQDNKTSQVLMLGYMNKQALEMTFESGYVTFYSRTKKKIWKKGETSGNVLRVIQIDSDCDNDSLLIKVEPNGPCCHLQTESCFLTCHSREDGNDIDRVLNKLVTKIEQRYQTRPENSYVTQLFESGIYRIAQKVGEEGVELALAAVKGNSQEIINEASDLFFHLLVLLRYSRVEVKELFNELNRRMD